MVVQGKNALHTSCMHNSLHPKQNLGLEDHCPKAGGGYIPPFLAFFKIFSRKPCNNLYRTVLRTTFLLIVWEAEHIVACASDQTKTSKHDCILAKGLWLAWTGGMGGPSPDRHFLVLGRGTDADLHRKVALSAAPHMQSLI